MNVENTLVSGRNVLITGGAGFIGSHLAIKLVEKGYSVTVLDNLSPQIHGEDPEKSDLYKSIIDKVIFIYGSVIVKKDWEKALIGQDVLVHLAAETGTGQSMYEVERYTDINIKGTAILFDLLANTDYNLKKMVVASSRAIYGEGKYQCPDDGVVYPSERKDKDMIGGDFGVKCPLCNKNVNLLATDEDSKIHPTSIYGITKQVQEQIFMVMGESLGIPSVALRYQNVYGPGQSLSNPYTGILSIFSTRIKNGNDINVFEDGAESRDFVYIDDAVDATILGIERVEANKGVFNVGTGSRVDVVTVANTLKKLYDSSAKIVVSGNYRLGDIRDNYADLNKIKSTLGFTPKVRFEDGIRDFADWVNTQEIRNDLYDKSISEMKDKGLYK